MLGCIYTSVRYLPLVYVALVSNLGPLFTAFFSYLWLKKGLTSLDLKVLAISFFGVALLVTGTIETTKSDAEQHETLWLPILCMLMVPLLTGTLAITQRELREVSEFTIGPYISYTMLLVFGPLTLFSAETKTIGELSAKFRLLDWFLFVLLGGMSSWVSICRSKSYQYQEPAKLAAISYF